MDRLLDHARVGPLHLRQREIAQVVVDSLEKGVELGHYELHAWVILPNHVHLLLTPLVPVSSLMGSLKRASAVRANEILHRTGLAFWQDESFDRLVRDEAEFRKILRYIESNPVAAGLVTTAEEYQWSSVGRPRRPRQAPSLPYLATDAASRS